MTIQQKITKQYHIFAQADRTRFAEHYPEVPHMLRHSLKNHDLLTIDALARLAEILPNQSIEYNRGDLAIGSNEGDIGNGMSIADTIRHIASANSWAVLKNIEQAPEYEALLLSLLEEIRAPIEEKTGAMLRPQGFVFISSPGSMTPYHFDPEHNILLQISGEKWMTQFPAGDERFAPSEYHEAYHHGSGRNLPWHDDLLQHGTRYHLASGDAMFVPVMAPHFVQNGDQPSLSLSITWRSEWSFAEADAHGFNRLIRKLGITPQAPARWPRTNKPKALAFRIARRLKLAR